MVNRLDYFNETNNETVSFDIQCNGPNSYVMRFFNADDTVDSCRPVWKQEFILWQTMVRQKDEIVRLVTELELSTQALKLARDVIAQKPL